MPCDLIRFSGAGAAFGGCWHPGGDSNPSSVQRGLRVADMALVAACTLGTGAGHVRDKSQSLFPRHSLCQTRGLEWCGVGDGVPAEYAAKLTFPRSTLALL